MRRFLIAALAVGLALGGLTLFAGRSDPDHGVASGPDLPAPLDVFETEIVDAHHTHSPTTICNWLADQWGSQWVVIDADTIVYLGDHPYEARCLIRDNVTFAQRCRHIYYYDHTRHYCH